MPCEGGGVPGWAGAEEGSIQSPLLGTTYPKVLHWAGLKGSGLLGGQRLFRWSPLLPGGVQSSVANFCDFARSRRHAFVYKVNSPNV